MLKFLFNKYSKWILLEVYYFNTSWYFVEVRQNIKNGKKQFRCKKFICWHYGHTNKNLSVESIENILKTTLLY